MKIDSFRGEYRFLSNFWPAYVEVKGYTFPSAEHAFQAMKSEDTSDWLAIHRLQSPVEAKRYGRKVRLRPNWNHSRIGFMRDILASKFADQKLRRKLLDTGDATLIEGNDWNDTFWGVCRGQGSNHLGKLLMELREELRQNS